ncbi:Major facilitator superfamily domain-containing protein 3 [Paramecium bursaria]
MFKFILPITLLYALQGITVAMATMSIPNIFDYKDVMYQKYTFAYLVLFPYVVRVLFCPLLDYFYIDKFGKRRCQIVVILIVYSVVAFFSNVDSLDSVDMFFTQLHLISICAILDIPIGAFIVEQFPPDRKGHATLAQYVGWIVGGFTGSYVFATFNSVQFCNTYLFAVPQELPMVTISYAFRLMSYSGIGLAIFSQMSFTNENNVKHDTNLFDSYRSLLFVFGNPNLAKVGLFLFLFRLGLLPITLAQYYLLYMKNYTSGQIEFMQALTFPLACLLPFYLAKLIRIRRFEIRYIIIFSIYMEILSVLMVIMIYFLNISFRFPYRDFILNASLIIIWLLNLIIITMAQSFIYKIAQSSISATFTCIFSSIIYFSFLFEGVIVEIIENVDYFAVWIIGIILHSLILNKVGSSMTQVDQMSPVEFTLEIDIKKEKLIVSQEMTNI